MDAKIWIIIAAAATIAVASYILLAPTESAGASVRSLTATASVPAP
jgi:hypothetical protein